jgi:hypothetical protein
MTTAMTTRIAAGVTAAYLRDLAGRSAPPTPEPVRAPRSPFRSPCRASARIRTWDNGSRLISSHRARGRRPA